MSLRSALPVLQSCSGLSNRLDRLAMTPTLPPTHTSWMKAGSQPAYLLSRNTPGLVHFRCRSTLAPDACPSFGACRVPDAMQGLQAALILLMIGSLSVAPQQMRPEALEAPMGYDHRSRRRRRTVFRTRLRILAMLAYILSTSNAIEEAGVGKGNGHRHRMPHDL